MPATPTPGGHVPTPQTRAASGSAKPTTTRGIAAKHAVRESESGSRKNDTAITSKPPRELLGDLCPDVTTTREQLLKERSALLAEPVSPDNQNPSAKTPRRKNPREEGRRYGAPEPGEFGASPGEPSPTCLSLAARDHRTGQASTTRRAIEKLLSPAMKNAFGVLGLDACLCTLHAKAGVAAVSYGSLA